MTKMKIESADAVKDSASEKIPTHEGSPKPDSEDNTLSENRNVSNSLPLDEREQNSILTQADSSLPPDLGKSF